MCECLETQKISSSDVGEQVRSENVHAYLKSHVPRARKEEEKEEGEEEIKYT